MSATVYYHGNCPDGFTAAYVAHCALPTARLVACHYGIEPPMPHEGAGQFVYFVDFCPPRATLDAMVAAGHTVTVLDHHKTAQADLADWTGGAQVFDMERSGAGIAWDFFVDSPVERLGYSPLVAYVQDRDLWRHQLQYSKEVSAYIMSWEYTLENWRNIDAWLRTGFQACVAEGRGLLRLKRKDTDMICRQAYRAFIGGHEVHVVNATSLWSEVGDEMLQRHAKDPFAASYCDLKNENLRMWSLRSRQGEGSFDVSQIAAMYGGGGHRNAAGFRTTRPERPIDNVGV